MTVRTSILYYLLCAVSFGLFVVAGPIPRGVTRRQDASHIQQARSIDPNGQKGGRTARGVAETTGQILSAMATISANIDSFTSAVTTYQGGLLTMIPVENAELSLQSSITNCATAVKASKQLSEQDNAAVAAQIATILPKISGAANGLIAKAPQMQQWGVTPIVMQEISNIQVGMNDLSLQLQRIVTLPTVPALQSAAGSINGVLGQALKAFSPPPSTPPSMPPNTTPSTAPPAAGTPTTS